MGLSIDSLPDQNAAVARAPHLIHPKYRADIDGLRAIAVLMVLGFHAFPKRVPGGFVGVDIFFVISGFLISTILLENLAQERFSFAEFYIRRIKRIFPALLLVLFSTLAFGWLVLLSDEYRALGKHVMSGAGFVSNLLLWQESGYFDPAAESKPLLHLWSLAIEEQFYIVWPLVLWASYRQKLNLLLITLAVAACSFALNIRSVGTDTVAAFYAPQTRFWELLTGSLAAWLALYPPSWLKGSRWQGGHLPSVLGFGLLCAAFYLVNRDSVFPGWWAILPTVGTVLLIWAGPAGIFNRHILANRLLVWFGLISFPLYLWHWPLLSFSRIVEGDLPGPGVRLAAVAASVILAWLTYRFIEKPVRSGKGGGNARTTGALIMAMTAALAVGLVAFSGIAEPRNNNPALKPILTAIADWDYPGDLKASRFMRQTYYRSGDNPNITFMFGDSHVEQYGPRLAYLQRQKGSSSNPASPSLPNSVVFGTSGGCPPMVHAFEDRKVRQVCEVFRDSAMKFIEQDQVKTVVIGGCWNCYFLDEEPDSKAKAQGPVYVSGQRGENAVLELKKLLQTLSPRKKVYLLLDNPMGKPFDPKSYMSGNRISGVQIGPSIIKVATPDSEEIRLNQRLMAMAAEIGVEVINPVGQICRAGVCDVITEDKQFVYRDNHHLRPFYVLKKAQYLDKVLSGAH